MNNKFLFIASFLFLFLNNSSAQDAHRIDSLLAIYNNTALADTAKIAVMYKIFDAYMYYDQEKAGQYLSLIHDIAIKTKDEKEIAKYNGTKGVLFDIIGQPDSTRIYYEKAIAYYEKNNILTDFNYHLFLFFTKHMEKRC